MPAKSLITDEYVNTKRQLTFDYMKAFSIVFMVIIHIFEEWSVYGYGLAEQGAFGGILEFFGGPLAAPVFMFAMGLGMVFSSHRTPAQLFRRGLFLFILAYVLNFLRDTVRLLVLGALAGALGEAEFWYYFRIFLLNIDILQFAGLSFMLTALLKQIKVPLWGMGVIAVAMQAVGCSINLGEVTNPWVAYGGGLFVYTSSISCFPLLLWYVYPVAGMIAAKYIKQMPDLDRWHRVLFGVCATVLTGYLAALFAVGYNPYQFFTLNEDAYYRQDFLHLIFTLAVIGFVEPVVYFVAKRVHLPRFEKLLMLMSNRLNEIYINQWLLIGLGCFLFESELVAPLSYVWVVPAGLGVLALAILLSGATKKLMSHIKA